MIKVSLYSMFLAETNQSDIYLPVSCYNLQPHVIVAESKSYYLTFQVPNLSNPEFVEDIFLLPRSKDKQVCQTVFLKWCCMVTIINFVFSTKLVNQEVYL